MKTSLNKLVLVSILKTTKRRMDFLPFHVEERRYVRYSVFLLQFHVANHRHCGKDEGFQLEREF